jgi:ATP-dependent DNA helicase RecG
MSLGTPGSELSTLPSATMDDLDFEKIDRWLLANFPHLADQETPREDALIRLRLASLMGPRVVPHVAAILAFGREPQWLLPHTGIAFASYAGTSLSSEVLARAHLSGTLGALHKSAIDRIREHSRSVINQVDPEASVSEFPAAAVFEAVANAIVHRDLRAPGSIQIRLFPGRLEIWSPGSANALPEPIENYLAGQGVSLARNPMIAVLARLEGISEQLGRGLSVMKHSVERDTGGRVHVQSTKDGVTVTIPSTLEVMTSQKLQTAN